jgi:adenine-specific DNA-methyltransferase
MDYTNLSKDELVELLKRRDAQTPLGIVWERNEIDHENSLNDDFIAMEVHPDLSVGDAPWTNLLIEGDNFDALRYLCMTFKGKVKAICIDPPYNTGNKDFIYNDKFLDKDNRFKHSVWLEFMYRRLLLAKDLLRNDGVIFVNIGEDELGHLSMLMDKVFPGMKVGTFVWKRRSGSNDAKGAFLSVDHEYVLCYANPNFTFAGDLKDTDDYQNPDGDDRGAWVSGDLTKAHTMKQRQEAYYPIHNPETDTWYPCNPDRVWAFASEKRLKPGQKIRTHTMEQMIRDKMILWKDDVTVFYATKEELLEAIDEGTAPRNLRRDQNDLDFWVGKTIGVGMPRYKKHLSKVKRTEKPLSTWIIPKSADKDDLLAYDIDDANVITSGYTSDGTALLRKMIGQNDFPYPKPLALIKGLLQQSTGSDDIVLDFFGGSATTAHAVMELNNEDDGNRRFIIVSSTEATIDDPEKNICRNIARIRLWLVINGYSYRSGKNTKNVEPISGDFAYMTMSRIPSESVGMLISHDQIWIALQLMNDDRVYPYSEGDIFQTAKYDDKIVVYLQETTNAALSAIEKAIRQFPAAIVYSWEPGIVRRQLIHPGLTVEKIPEFLMQSFGNL